MRVVFEASVLSKREVGTRCGKRFPSRPLALGEIDEGNPPGCSKRQVGILQKLGQFGAGGGILR